MELTHTFTVPTPVEETWAHFQDIAALAECFPGAQVTSAEGDSFEGTCKVKLGPIALVYSGSGTFTERDDTAHRFVVDAKGRDKRGNGTAGAHVTLTMAESGGGTVVEVVTDLAITGKPAQFGRGVMQDVSDKLLGQFVACLEQRIGDAGGQAGGTGGVGGTGGADEPDQDAEPASQPTGAAAVAPPEGDQDAGPASAAPGGAGAAGAAAGAATATGANDGGSASSRPPRSHAASRPDDDDALDLGAAVLPVLLKSYGKQVAAGLAGLLVLRWLVKRARGRK